MADALELVIAFTAKDMASHALEGVSKKIEGLGTAGKLAVAGFAALGAAGVGLATTLVGFAEHAASAAGEVRKLARETGLSAEEASKLRFAAERLNIDTDTLSKSFGILSKHLVSTPDFLEQYGMSLMTNADGTVNMAETVKGLAAQFASMPDGVEKTNLSLQLFGKGGKDMIPLLNQGTTGLYQMGEEATRLGLVFSKEGVESARKFGLAQKDLSERFEGMKNTVGIAVLPILTKLFEFFTDLADKVLPPVTKILGRVVEILSELFGVISGKAPDAGAALTDAIGPDAAKVIMGALGGIRDTAVEVFRKVNDAIDFLKEHWDFFGPAFAAIALTVIVPAMIAWGTAAAAAALATLVALAPVLLTLAVIGAAVGLLALAWKNNWGDIQGKTKAAVEFIYGVLDALAATWEKVWNGIVDVTKTVVAAILRPIQTIIDAVQNAINWLHSLAAQQTQVSGPGGEQNPGGGYVGTYQHGTPFVPQTGLALVHQGERIIPAGQNRTGGWAPVVNITVEGSLIGLDSDDLANRLGDVFYRQYRLAGGTT